MMYSFWNLFLWLPCFLALHVFSTPVPTSEVSNRAAKQIVTYTAVPNGKTWYDKTGNPIQAFGGGFLLVGNTYYWVGQDSNPDPLGDEPTGALVNLYKSTDLLNWAKVGAIISVYTKDVNGVQQLTNCKIERPKLLYNQKTGKYIVWAHWETAQTYAASEVVTATADHIEGPYSVTAKGHRRPGIGNNDAGAMGDRLGGPVVDYNISPKNVNNTVKPYKPANFDYPLRVLQYNDPDTKNPETLNYVSQSNGYGTLQAGNSWTYEMGGIHFNTTLKAIAVKMTPFDRSLYDKYLPDYSVGASTYIVRYPTTTRSPVTTSVFTIGDPGNQRSTLVAPVIHPGLNESSSKTAVLVNSGDAAFVTVVTDGATIYYTTDGSNPSDENNAKRQTYWTGTRITVSGTSGTTLTVKAAAELNGIVSAVVSQTYQVAADPASVPVFAPIINFPTGTYSTSSSAFGYMSMKIYCPTYGAECYYTMDGRDPNPPTKGSNIGYGSRDETVWRDPKTNDAFLVTAADNIYMRVWKLSADYTDVDPVSEYDIFVGMHREAPALVRNYDAGGTYVYLITSDQSGYYPNQAQFTRTKDLAAGFSLPRDSTTGYRGGQSIWTDLQPVGDATTYWSQPTYIINIGTDAKPLYVYIGDRYYTAANARSLSTYVWMPLTIDDNGTGGSVKLEFRPELQLDVAKKQIVSPKWKLLSLKKPVQATTSVALTADQLAAGTYNYSAQAANDGINFDIGPYDDVEQYFKPTSVPFYWRVDLQSTHDLAWIGLSFISVGGSDAVNRYTVSASKSGSTWDQLVDNTANPAPGFQSHTLSGSYRYIQVNVYSVWDVAHGKEADWEVGVYEVSVYGN
jgi:hypothetical protein